MSKLSPYHRSNPYRKEVSPIPKPYENTPLFNEKERTNKITASNYSKPRNNNDEANYNYKPTQKKKYDNISNYDLDILLQKNISLANENTELYQMLQERGRIVTALQKKLQQQIHREVITLKAIEQEKNKFINDSHKKFKDYERKMQELKKEIYILNQQKYQQNMIKVHEIELIKDTFTKQQILKMHELASNQINAREATQFERSKARNLLEIKKHQIDDLSFQYQNCIDTLKNQIVELNSQILHINHIRKIEISEQKLMYEHMIDNQTKQYIKEREVMSIEHDVLVKKLEQLLAATKIQTNKIQQLKKIGQIQQNVREQELIEKKAKLQESITQLEAFYKKNSFQQTQKLKQLNRNEINALEAGNETISNSLKEEIAKLINLNSVKTNQIRRLYDEILIQRQQSNQTIKSFEQIIEQLKEKMRDMEKNYCIQQQQIKIKWAQLSHADISILKQYYQHELEVLQHQLHETTKLADSNRQKLHQQLQEKNELRKRFELEAATLNTRISQLQLHVDELHLKKKQETTSLNTVMNMTSSKLLRETLDKEKIHQNNEEEKKKLQQLISVKDKQIEELNQKIRLMKQNYSKQIQQKNVSIQIIKKHKQDLELQLKKQKYFYTNQLKTKDSIIKTDKEHYDNEFNILKKNFRQQYDSTVAELNTKIAALEVEVNKLKAVEKNLKQEILTLKQFHQVEVGDKKEQLEGQRDRLQKQKKNLEDRLKNYYLQQTQLLQDQINELRKQLQYKEEDIRNISQKYHKLQQKMALVMQSQEKLRNIEQRIINLGQENSLVNSFAQIVKNKIKQ